MWEWVLRLLHDNIGFTLLGAVTLIQIAPIKISPWSWCGKIVRNFLIGDIEDKLDNLAGKLDKLEQTVDESDAVLARTHILRFADEIYNGVHHSKEYFDQQLDDIDRYDKYCDDHPGFKNSRTVMAAKNIKETYDRLVKEHKFL